MRLWRYLKPYWPGMTLVVCLVALQSIAQLYLPNLMATIVDDGVAKNDIPLIWRSGTLMLVVTLAAGAAAISSGYLSARISAGFGRDLRHRVFAHVETFSLAEFDRLGSASLIVRTTNDVTQVQNTALMVLRMVISAPITTIGGVGMAIALDPQLSLILAAVIPLLVMTVFLLARVVLTMFRAVQRHLDKLNLVFRENLTGIRVIRAFDRAGHEQRRVEAVNRDLTELSLKVHRTMALMMPFIMLVLNATTVAAFWIGAYRVDDGQLEVGALMAFIQYAMQILMSLLMMSMIFVMLPRAAASAERINEVLDTKPAVIDPPMTRLPGTTRGEIEFRDVTFTYPGATRPALDQVSFVARPGRITAIIGGTGSGKSTAINLALRFYDASGGSVLVDGVDVRDWAQAELRGRIGYVSQKSVLFSGTVAENLRYGRAGATDEEVRHAAGVAQALEFITAMPQGLESPIAQAGVNLSGGQKQRLAIARAVLRRPSVYVLDDCFSALDYRTEARLRAALRREAQEAAVLVVAQRVASVMDADQIVVLDEGRVVGMGSHAELLENNAVYREIVTSQLPGEVVA
jgi:ATP-binding cassette subfamily B protein